MLTFPKALTPRPPRFPPWPELVPLCTPNHCCSRENAVVLCLHHTVSQPSMALVWGFSSGAQGGACPVHRGSYIKGAMRQKCAASSSVPFTLSPDQPDKWAEAISVGWGGAHLGANGAA